MVDNALKNPYLGELRDKIATAALQALIGNDADYMEENWFDDELVDRLAMRAYRFADGMLAARLGRTLVEE